MTFAPSSMHLTSSSFSAMQKLAKRYTHEGEDISPALSWQLFDNRVRSLAVICHDPDAPLVQHGQYGFVHWLLYNLPADLRSLPEGYSEGTLGINDFGNCTYNGPMPPEGNGPHHYYFWVIALDTQLNLPQGLNLPELLSKLEPHILAMDRLIGSYER